MTLLSALERARRDRPGVPDALLVTGLVDALLAETEVGPPVDVGLLASWQGVTAVERVPLAWSGCISAGPAGVTISLRESDGYVRQRFTCCHEVAHTLMPGFGHGTRYRCTPGGPVPAGTDAHVEQLCDQAASELLLPRAHVHHDLLGRPFGLDAVEHVADAFGASLDATARRLVALSPGPVLMLDLRPGTSRADPVPRLRVHASLGSGPWPFVPRNKGVTAGHPFGEATHGVDVDLSCDLGALLALGIRTPVRVVARSYPYTDHRGARVDRVLALAQPVPGAGTAGT